MSDPLEPVRNIRSRVEEIAADMNLQVGGFALIPSFEGGPDMIQATFVLSPEAVETLDQTVQRQTDDAFAQLMGAGFGDSDVFADEETLKAKQAEEDRANNILNDLKGWVDSDDS